MEGNSKCVNLSFMHFTCFYVYGPNVLRVSHFSPGTHIKTLVLDKHFPSEHALVPLTETHCLYVLTETHCLYVSGW